MLHLRNSDHNFATCGEKRADISSGGGGGGSGGDSPVAYLLSEKYEYTHK